MKRLSMRKIREALRLSFEGLSTREMALSLAIGRTTLREYLGRARDAGLSWPLPDALSDADLEHVLFPTAFCGQFSTDPSPDWTYVHAELRRKGGDAFAVVAGVSRGSHRRLWLQPVLRGER